MKNQLREFKYNDELFKSILVSQPLYKQPNPEWSIVLGNREASNVITMVTNPYCAPCSTTHKLLNDLINQNRNIQARILFTTSYQENDQSLPVVRHMMSLNELPDKMTVSEALHNWYKQENKYYEIWAKAYPITFDGIEMGKLEKQKQWCLEMAISSTPTLLVNGYRLPRLYRLSDLKYML